MSVQMPIRTLRREGTAYVRIDDVISWLLWERLPEPTTSEERAVNMALAALADTATRWKEQT